MIGLRIILTVIGIILSVAILSFSATIYVPANYSTIQTAVDAASPGDTVWVNAGTYTENITIDKNLYLFGDRNRWTVIDGGGTGDVVNITADNVTLRTLQIINSGSTQLFEDNWDAGIKIDHANSCSIQFCDIRYNGAAGIAATASSYNFISECNIAYNVVGIYYYEHYDEEPLSDNIGSKILDNLIFLNTGNGIDFTHTIGTYHYSNYIQNNVIYGNDKGFTLIMSQENEISHNLFIYNISKAIIMTVCSGGGSDNVFHHNSIIDNGDSSQAYYSPDCYMGWEHLWFSPSENVGNYWSDYTGDDLDSNGIGDEPYAIEGYCDGCAFDCADPYPLMAMDDLDADGRSDSLDNCIDIPNSSQYDHDFDGVGDSCDNCPTRFNPDQADADGNNIGNICENWCGDTNVDTLVNIFDVTSLISHLYMNGMAPHPLESGDVNDDEAVNIFDVTFLITYLYKEGEAPFCPGS